MPIELGKPLYIGEGNLIIWEGLADAFTEEPLANATVKFTLLDDQGEIVGNAVDVDMLLVTDGNGSPSTYKGTLTAENAELLEEGKYYLIERTATFPSPGPGDTSYEPAFRRTKHVAEYHGTH